MKAKKVFFIVLGIAAALALLFFCSFDVYGGEDAFNQAGKKLNPPSDGADSEQVLGSTDLSGATRTQQSPLIQKLNDARRVGDMKTFRKLEALFPKAPAGGESSAGMMKVKSATFGGAGDPTLGNGPQNGGLSGPEITAFGADIHVRSSNFDHKEWNQAMVSDSKGNLYVAWQDNGYATGDYIQIYESADGGKSWKAYGYVMNSGADLKEPSLAVGEGAADTLLVAYIMDDGVNTPVPEVATAKLGSSSFTIHSVPVWKWEAYAKPVINTDAVHWQYWIGYLTCEGIYDSAAANVNVCSWRTLDYGATWEDELVVLGDLDADAWLDPDETYGTSLCRVIISCFNDTDDTIYTMSSDDFCWTFNAPVTMYAMPAVPNRPVDPEIAAALNNDNVMLCCTKSYSGNDNIGQGYSKDGGDTWSYLYSMTDYTEDDEFAVSLTANEGGYDWHLAYTRNYHVFFTKRYQDLSGAWTTPELVDDLGWASNEYPRKGIASNWTTNYPCVAWADFRDPVSGDYDTYADFPFNPGLCSSTFKIPSGTGGSVQFTLNAGIDYKYRQYLMLGSITGTSPGIPLPGGYATLPLKWDLFTNIVIGLINTPVFDKFYGTLDAAGMAKATLTLGPVPGAGYELYFAFATMNPWDYASNAVSIWFSP